jgi:hypothetical protein
MKRSKLITSGVAVALLASGLTGLFQSPASAKANRINQLLIQQGLTPTECRPGVVAIWLDLNKELACAIPNSQYPAGVYRLTSEYGFTSIIRQRNPTASSGNSATSPAAPSSSPTNVTVVLGNPTGSVSAPIGTQPPAIATPSILFTANPSQAVSPIISTQINAALSAKGLTLTSCSANPGVVVMMGQYMACAYPTDIYPPGRYSLSF